MDRTTFSLLYILVIVVGLGFALVCPNYWHQFKDLEKWKFSPKVKAFLRGLR